MNRTILIVEDETQIRDMIKFALNSTEFEVLEAENAANAEKIILATLPDLILLDWMLPDKDGLLFIKKLKTMKITQNIPVIMLTAKAEESSKIQGLEAGADDYVTKPFSPRELISRIRAVLRRGTYLTPDNIINIRDMTVNANNFEVKINNEDIKLTGLEFNILLFFIKHKNKICNREQLLDFVWGRDKYIEDRTVDVHIRRLRKKLASHNYADLIQTVYGEGYKLTD